jgi:hypothetical protein
LGDQAQIADVRKVVVEGGIGGERLAGDERFEEAPYPGLVQAGEQGVQMGGAGEDQSFLGGVDMFGCDRDLDLVDDLGGERIDQPGLPSAVLPRPGQCVLGEWLSGLSDVLSVELA